MKKTKIVLILVLLFCGTSLRGVNAQGNISISAPNKVYSNEGFTITVSFSNSHPSGWIINSSGLPGYPSNIFTPGASSISTKSGSTTKTFKLPKGTYTLNVNTLGTYAEVGDDYKEVKAYNQKTITVVDRPAKPDPKPTNPTKPTKPGTGGPSSGGQREEEEKQNAKNDPEKAEELKKAEEEAEKEEKKNTPLFSEMKITSMSDRNKDEVIETIKAEKSIFDYTYTLPKRIDSFSLELKELEKDVTLTYDKEFTFKEDEKSIKIPIKAKQGDISQDITLEVKKNDEIDAEFKLEDSAYTVYKDDLLDKYMKENGFESVKFKLGNVETVKFKKNKLELILLVDDQNNAKWVSIDEQNNVQFEVDLVRNAADKLLVIAEVPDDMKFEKIRGEGYTAKNYEIDKAIIDMDKSLVFEKTYKSWTLVEEEKLSVFDSWAVSADGEKEVNEIVFAAKDDGEFDLLNNNDSKELAKVMMLSFDQATTGNFQLYALIATGISVMLLIICFVLLYVLKKTRSQFH